MLGWFTGISWLLWIIGFFTLGYTSLPYVIPHFNDYYMCWLMINVILFFITICSSMSDSTVISTHKKTITYTTSPRVKEDDCTRTYSKKIT